MNYFKILLIAFSVVIFSGCAQQRTNMYHWGSYEDIIYQNYESPGELNIQEQIELLNADIIEAQSEGKKIFPGFYAHLGYLYFSDGNYTAASQAFNMEQTLFPESGPFLKGIIDRMKEGE